MVAELQDMTCQYSGDISIINLHGFFRIGEVKRVNQMEACTLICLECLLCIMCCGGNYPC